MRISSMLFVAAGLVAGSAIAQTSPAGQRPDSTAQQGPAPIFRVTVVGHSTPAINYRPRKGDTDIDFKGTPLMPMALGKANVRGKKGVMDIEAEFDKLQSPAQFGPEYLTYVLWAITPEGRATNLGEVQVRGDEAKIRVTTELQAFGMIVTAEPYFAVAQPSDVVVLENSVRYDTRGSVDIIQAKYDLLKRGTYLMDQDRRQVKIKPLEPGAPLDLAEARNAVMLARVAQADRYAADSYQKAARLLTDAEDARARKRSNDVVMMAARQSVQTAEDARLISLQKQEEAFQAEQRERAKEREAMALERARAEEATRKLAELERLQAETARFAAERDRALAEAARLAAENQAQQARALAEQSARDRAAADAARLAAENQALQARALAEQSGRDKAAAEAARLAAENQALQAKALAEQSARDKAAADAARQAAEGQAQQAREAAAQADRDRAALRGQLRQQLNQVLETRESVRGLIVNLSDVLFDTGSATLKPGAREKLARVSGILLAHPELKVQVEGHTDNVGQDDYNQRLSENRADSVRSYIVAQGIASSAVTTKGFGMNQPVASNDTAAGRQQNRRVELVVAGDTIGTGAAQTTGRTSP
jgi:outer membrane protein OmpA-like peptidoglycan-associated protein